MTGYALIDSGDQHKLERFGDVTLVRPSSQALWHKKDPGRWRKAHATFERDRGGTGTWVEHQPLSVSWRMQFANVTWNLRPNDHGNLGIFPEQASSWEWIEEVLAARQESADSQAEEPPEILNLFAYTGGSTFAAARAGARVVHLDASKTSVEVARENAECSGLDKKPIRWITEDAVKFVRREAKRGRRYHGIVLDPPTYGRGTDAEVWKIEEGIGELLDLCRSLLADDASFLLFSSHSPGFTPIALENQLVAPRDSKVESGEMTLTAPDGRRLPSGAYARWSRP